MADHLADFAAIAADCVHDIATGTLVDALASLEHALPSLRREQRYAGQAVARALHHLASGQPAGFGTVDEVVYLARCAAWWASLSPTRTTMVEVGRCLERGSISVDLLDAGTCKHLRQLLRMVLGEVQRAVVANGKAVERAA